MVGGSQPCLLSALASCAGRWWEPALLPAQRLVGSLCLQAAGGSLPGWPARVRQWLPWGPGSAPVLRLERDATSAGKAAEGSVPLLPFWLQLCSSFAPPAAGDTQLVDSEFHPFLPHKGPPRQVAAAEQEAGAGSASAAAKWEAVAAAAATAEGGAGASMDADLALALALQAEEEERMQLAEQRRREAAARREQGAALAGSAPPARVLPSHQQQHLQRPQKPKKDKKSSDCVVM